MALPVNAGDKLLAEDVNKLGPFGDFASKTDGTVYQAVTDGFVFGNMSTGGGSAIIYVDTFNPPTTVRARATSHSNGYYNSAICPVQRGSYYKTTGFSSVWWVPVGS